MTQPRKNRYSYRALAVLMGGLIMLALAVPSTALETLTLTPSSISARAAQNYIDQANATTVDSDALQVESRNGQNRRALVMFDFSQLPDVGIKSATLTLTVETDPSPLTGNRTYDIYPLTSFFTSSNATWDTRVADLGWDTAGGDYSGTLTNSQTVRSTTKTVAWTVTSDVESWYSGSAAGVPVANYGELIKDSAEGSNGFLGTYPTTVFYPSSATTVADRPALTVTFVQNVTNLTATPSGGQLKLNWSYPNPIGTVVDATKGVMILRRSGLPVDKGSVPSDGTTYALCATIGTGTVVFNNTAMATTFTDSSTDTCGAPANGTMYYYKVFTQDSAHNYSATGTGTTGSDDGGSLSVPEISAMPSAGAGAAYASKWMTATYSTTLAPPSLFPGVVAMVGTQTAFLFGVNPTTGARLYPPISLGGAVSGRSPVIDAADSSLAEDTVYVADQSGLAYAIAADTGEPIWTVDPLSSGGTPFLAAGAVLLKKYAISSFAPTHDILVLGTRNSNTHTGNAIVAVDGNTGATVWTDIGGVNGFPSIDIINATPTISYPANTIWLTSESNGGAQPSLWELNANTGAVIASLKLGDIDSSPTLTPDGTILFVGTNAGNVYAINTATATAITSYVGTDGEIVDYPLVIGFSSPYSVFYSGSTGVHGLTYNATAKTFTSNWNTTITTPSAPIGVYSLSSVYVGGGDGLIHELAVSTGVDTQDFIANAGQPGVVGDPALDTDLMQIYVSTNDQRMYAFPFPF